MASVTIVKTNLKFNTPADFPAGVAIHATDGGVVAYDQADHKILLIMENTSAATVTATVKAGNALQGVADLAVSIPANAKKCVTVESGAYANSSGPNRGNVLITGPATVTVAAVTLP